MNNDHDPFWVIFRDWVIIITIGTGALVLLGWLLNQHGG